MCQVTTSQPSSSYGATSRSVSTECFSIATGSSVSNAPGSSTYNKQSTGGVPSSCSRTVSSSMINSSILAMEKACSLTLAPPSARRPLCAESLCADKKSTASGNALRSESKDDRLVLMRRLKQSIIREDRRHDESDDGGKRESVGAGALSEATIGAATTDDYVTHALQRRPNIELFVWLKLIFSFDAGCFSAALGGEGGIADTWQLSVAQQGTLTSSVFLGGVVGCVMAGYCFSKYSEKMVLMTAVLVHMIGTLLFASIQSYTLALMSRSLIGITISFVVVYTPVWVCFFAPSEHQSTWMAAHNVGVPVGIVIGYVAAQVMMEYYDSGWKWAFYLKCVTLVATLFSIASTHAHTLNVRQPLPNIDGSVDASAFVTRSVSAQQPRASTLLAADTTNKERADGAQYSSAGLYTTSRRTKTCDALPSNIASERDDGAVCENVRGVAYRDSDMHNNWPSLYSACFIESATGVQLSVSEDQGMSSTIDVRGVGREDGSHSCTGSDVDVVTGGPHASSSIRVDVGGAGGGDDVGWRRDWLHARSWMVRLARKAKKLCMKRAPMLSNSMYMCTVLMLCSLYFISSGLQNFVTLYLRGDPFNASMRTIVVGFSVCVVVAPVCGAVVGGLVLDHFGGYNNNLLHVSIFCLVAATVGVVFSIICTLMNTTTGFLVTMFVVLFSGGALVPPGAGLTMVSLPEEQRVRGAAFAQILFNLLGNSGGPLMCGYVAYWTGSLTVAIVLLLLSSSLGLVPIGCIFRVAYRRERCSVIDEVDVATHSGTADVVVMNSEDGVHNSSGIV